MTDSFLGPGESNPNDVRLTDPTQPSAANGTALVSGLAVVLALGVAVVSGDAIVSATGVSTISAVGTATASASAVTTASGVSAAVAFGTPTATGAATIAASGVSANSSIGTATANGASTVALIGLSANTALGTITATGSAQVAVSGVASASAVGSVHAVGDPSSAFLITLGIGEPAAIGPFLLVGLSAGPAIALPVGVSATTAIGTVQAVGDPVYSELITLGIGTPADVSHFVLVGLSATASAIAAPAGVEVTTAIGTAVATAETPTVVSSGGTRRRWPQRLPKPTPQRQPRPQPVLQRHATAHPAGVELVCTVGSVTPSASADILVSEGAIATAAIGTVDVQSDAQAQASGSVVRTTVGRVEASGTHVAALTLVRPRRYQAPPPPVTPAPVSRAKARVTDTEDLEALIALGVIAA